MPRTRLAVLPALLALAACKPDKTDDTGLSEEPESFALGEVRDLETVDGGVQATFEQPGTYILVLFSAADDEGTRYAYGPDYGAEARTTPPDPVPDRYRLPERPAAGGGAAVPPPDSTRTFTVYDGSSYVNVEAEFVTLTDELVIWRDTTTDNPMGDIDEEVLDGVVSYFEDLVLPRERAIWGEEPDVDDSGRIDVLPTGRTARFSSGLNVLDFMKKTTISRMTPESLRAIGPAAATLAASESLEAHGLSVLARLEALNDE